VLPEDRTVTDLLAQPADAVLAFVQRHRAAIDCMPAWRDLAYGAGAKPICWSDPTTADALTWAAVAVLIADCLAECCHQPGERSAAALEAMSLRACMLNTFGPRPGHPVLDPPVLEDWFFKNVDIPYESALHQSRYIVQLSTNDFLTLSRLKDRIRIMQGVKSQQLFRRADELARWYKLLEDR